MREGTELLADEVAGPLTVEQKEIADGKVGAITKSLRQAVLEMVDTETRD